jgi:NodT family efflux transporter outer membrane factor (OMF) lipoprotein
MTRRLVHGVSITAFMALAACSLAPDYHRPEMVIPESYKESAGDWIQATPQNADAKRGPWWTVYNDADLNGLEDKVSAANQDLKAALARYEEARASADVARAGYFPSITATGDANRQRMSKNVAAVRSVTQYNDFSAGADLSYELDVWGRVRNAVAAGESEAKASAADLAAIDLSLHSEMAMDYFALRGQDAAQIAADQAVASYEKALQLTQARHAGGVSPAADVDQAQTQFETAKTLAADTRLKRAQLEHAIAVLAGEAPAGFSVAVKTSDAVAVPSVPGMPSKLLEQRPDIAAAALRVEAANAEIGVARAAYFPDFSFSAAGGFESAVASKLLKAPSLFWSLGPSVMLPVFDGGKINALSAQAHAAYDESVANYRQSVLTAFQQVEDNLAALRQLAQENDTQLAATAAAQRALVQAKNRYSGGIATYLDVVVAQNIALQAELSAIDIRTRRLTASIQLIKALGGGWHDGDTLAMPKAAAPQPNAAMIMPLLSDLAPSSKAPE